MKWLLLTSLIALLSACSFKQPPNAWQIKAISSFEQYQHYFLSNKKVLAQSSYQKAQQHAKQSANLETLGRVYLGSCALNNAVLLEDSCQNYVNLKSLEPNQTLHNYHLFISKQFTKIDPKALPKRYQDIALALKQQDKRKVNALINQTENLTSQLIAASVSKNLLTQKTIRNLIQKSADYGYQLASIQWMLYLAKHTANINEAKALQEKVKIMLKPSH